MMRHLGLAILCLLVVPGGRALAMTTGEGLYLGGFVSQGYLNSADHNYLIPNTREGSGAFNEVALHVTAEPGDDLRVGIQLLGRDFGSRTTASVVVDWAYGDYRWRDQLGFRAGKIKLPIGLYNQGRDIDMLRTAVLLPQSVYAEQDRELLIAYEGIGAYGSILLGRWGELDYELCYGSLSVPDGGIGPTNDAYREGARQSIPFVAAAVADRYSVPVDSVSVELADSPDPELAVPWIAGGSLIWLTPITGLRVGGTYFAGDVEAAGSYRYDVLVGDGDGLPTYLPWTVSVDQDLDLHSTVNGSLEYVRGRWTLAAEFARTRFAELSDLGWYASNQVQLSSRWSAAVTYSEYYPNRDDRDGHALAAAGLAEHGAWQRDLGLSVRFDVNEHWLLKLEWHAMDGTAMILEGGPDAATDNDRYWRMLAAKTTFHF